MKRWLGLLAVCGLVACAGGPPIQTASGVPEVTLVNVDAACVRGLLLSGFVDQGFMVRSVNDSQVVAGRIDMSDRAFLYATQFGGFPEHRITVLFIPLPDSGMRIVVNEALVANAGSGFERSNPIRRDQAAQEAFAASGRNAQAMCGRS